MGELDHEGVLALGRVEARLADGPFRDLEVSDEAFDLTVAKFDGLLH